MSVFHDEIQRVRDVNTQLKPHKLTQILSHIQETNSATTNYILEFIDSKDSQDISQDESLSSPVDFGANKGTGP